MCSHTRLIYTLTYRALREFASGRKSVNPIEELHRMETCVPFSVCLKTHDTMMKAQDSFNDRYLKPSIVHEPLIYTKAINLTKATKRVVGISRFRDNWDVKVKANIQIRELKARLWAHKVSGFYSHVPLQRLDAKARVIRLFSSLPLSA